MSFLGDRHTHALSVERSSFALPWFINHLQGKHRSFTTVKIKKFVQWGDWIKQFVVKHGKEWFKDIEIVYVPMCWGDSHLVGLLINLKIWSVEIFDLNPSGTSEKKVLEHGADRRYVTTCNPILMPPSSSIPTTWTQPICL